MQDKDTQKLSQYELDRQRRIKENHDFMRSLGLPVPKTPKLQKVTQTTSKPKKKCKVFTSLDESSSSSESSDDSDMDWIPGVSEEVAKRKKMIKRFAPEFRPKRNLFLDFNSHKSKQTSTSGNDFEDLADISEQMMNDASLFECEEEKVEMKVNHETGSRYPTRSRSMKASYREAEVPDDDHYLYCEECQDLYYGDCPNHGALQPFPDKPPPSDHDSSKLTTARASLPDFLEIKPSKMPQAGLGVFSKCGVIPARVKFGPYKGEKVKLADIADDMDTSYMWEIIKDGKFSHFIDGAHENSSSWMRFVNCSRYEREQNLVAFQYKGEIYYRSYKEIPAGSELLVWYGDKYAQDLGISIEAEDNGQEGQQLSTESSLSLCKSDRQGLVKSKVYNSNEIKERICSLCRLTCGSAKEYDDHLKTHCIGSNLVCPVCKKKSTQKNSLMRHLRTHSDYRPYQCKHCTKGFTRLSCLTDHERIHTGIKPYQCKHCNKAFTQLRNLIDHERIHTGIKPYQCTYCNKSFTQLRNLIDHERIHTGIKPYQCKHCNKAFTVLHNLTDHERIHTGIKPYQCKHCNKSFTVHCNLTDHERIHTGIKPYQCKHCNKAFTRRGNLKSHERIHTGIKPV